MNKALQEAGANFAIQQLPDVLQQWLYYQATWDIILIVICSLAILLDGGVFVLSVIKMVRAERHSKPKEFWQFVVTVSGTPGGLLVVLPSIVCLFIIVPDLLMINLAPKVWLIQHISQLVH